MLLKEVLTAEYNTSNCHQNEQRPRQLTQSIMNHFEKRPSVCGASEARAEREREREREREATGREIRKRERERRSVRMVVQCVGCREATSMERRSNLEETSAVCFLLGEGRGGSAQWTLCPALVSSA